MSSHPISNPPPGTTFNPSNLPPPNQPPFLQAVPPGTTTASGSDNTLSSLPSSLITLLLVLAGPLRWVKKAIEVVTWSSGSPMDSWLVVLAWWAVCLGGRAAYKYILPPIILLLIPFPTSSHHVRSTLSNMIHSIPFVHPTPHPPTTSTPTNPASSQTVLLALSDLYAINAMITSFSFFGVKDKDVSKWVWGEGEGKWWAEMEKRRLIRGGIIIWSAWAFINWFLGGSVTLALLGTIVLLLPSPTLRSFQQLLSKSLVLRRLATTLFLVIFGSPPEPIPSAPTSSINLDIITTTPTPFRLRAWLKDKWTTSRRPSFALRLKPFPATTSITGSALDDEVRSDPSLTPCPPVYFRFELQENQRWWMGLDWTSALLPQERPSWCDVYLNPASPPSSFVLPSESVMYLPVPGRGGDARTKRTARWRWLDEDWTVVRKGGPSKEGKDSHEKTVSSSSADKDEKEKNIYPSDVFTDGKTTKGLAEQAFVKGLEKLKARNILGSAPVSGQPPGGGTSNPQPNSPTLASTFAASVGFGTGIMGGNVGPSPSRPRGSMDDARSTDSHTSSQEDEHRGRQASTSTEIGATINPTAAAHANVAGNLTGANVSGMTAGGTGGTTAVAAGIAALTLDLDVQTDADGWSYGDNKWEGMGPKGGLGKYTRRRRWQRRAICTETVEYIPASSEAVATTDSKTTTPRPLHRHSNAHHPAGIVPAPPIVANVVAAGPTQDSPAKGYAVDVATTMMPSGPVDRKIRTSSVGSERDQVLRQRLKNAMGSVGA